GCPQRGLSLTEGPARETEVSRPPQCAGQAPTIARPTEDVARLGQVALGTPILAGDRVDQAEPGEHNADAATIALRAAQIERAFESAARLRQRILGQLEVGTAHETRRPPT